MRYLTGGESHGSQLTVIIDGFPAGVPIRRDEISTLMQRRRLAPGRSSRMRQEADVVRYLSGIRGGKTLGSPITLAIETSSTNRLPDLEDRWRQTGVNISVPRPGHADLAGIARYGLASCGDVAERASARETAARVAVGGLALQLLARLGVKIRSSQLTAGGQTDVACAIEQATRQGETLGGTIEVEITGLPGGIGGCFQWDQRLDGRLAAAVMSIQAVKGVEIGPAFALADGRGSEYLDPFVARQGRWLRETNNAGGLEGGMTNGQPVVVRAVVKPVPTLDNPLDSFDFNTGLPAKAPCSRHDICAAGAAAVVAEAVCAWEIAAVVVSQTGGRTLDQLVTAMKEANKRWEKLTTCSKR